MRARKRERKIRDDGLSIWNGLDVVYSFAFTAWYRVVWISVSGHRPLDSIGWLEGLEYKSLFSVSGA